jgi:hypothetical protein
MGRRETPVSEAAEQGYVLDVRDLPLADGRPVTIVIDGEAEEILSTPVGVAEQGEDAALPDCLLDKFVFGS